MKLIDENGRYEGSEFTVEAPELKVLLSVVLSHYPNLHFWPTSSSSWDDVEGEPVVFYDSFEPLIHNWEHLRALCPKDAEANADETPKEDFPEVVEIKSRIEQAVLHTDVESQHVRALIFLGREDNFQKARGQLKTLMTAVSQAKKVSRYLSTVDVNTKAKTIQFELLWTLFSPGEIVFSKIFMGEPQLFIVKQCNEQQVYLNQQGYAVDNVETASQVLWRMTAWAYDWNGRTFQRKPVRFEFEQFPGSKPIGSLHCHPLKFHEGGGDVSSGIDDSVATVKKILLERGQRFKELCTKARGSQMFDYHGDAISHGVGFQKWLQEEDILLHMLRSTSNNHRLPRRREAQKDPKVQQVHGRVMVDFQAYLRHAPFYRSSSPMGTAEFRENDDECKCSTCKGNAALKLSQKVHYDGATADREFDELQYMICPPRVLGYHLESKTWLELNVGKRLDDGDDNDKTVKKGELYLSDMVHPIRTKAFDKLQLAKTQKTLIKDLVQSHASGTNPKRLMDNIMEGKGRGLVILLHGPPGVGKTLTAGAFSVSFHLSLTKCQSFNLITESVAQLAGKPLFSVGVSDIGLNPEDVERNFEALFELAANWRAVLLFDEADVFLESRSSHTSDLSRNALVSVLLRVLEYYDGILILTTNRIREFDIAVQSRVNLGIKYEDLDRDQKQSIFDQFLDQLPDENVEGRERIRDWFREDEEAREWVKALNGRQIRNILFSAASLAVKDGGVLKLDLVKRMTKSTALFHDSVKTIVEDARRKAEAGRM